MASGSRASRPVSWSPPASTRCADRAPRVGCPHFRARAAGRPRRARRVGQMAAPRSSILRAGRLGVAAAMDLVLPRTCPGCGGPGPWCDGCDATLRGRPRRVRLPELVAGGAAARLPPVWALTRYTDPVRSAILAGKEHGRRDLPARARSGARQRAAAAAPARPAARADLAGARAQQASGRQGPGRRSGHRDGRRRGPVRRRVAATRPGSRHAWSPRDRRGTRSAWTPPRGRPISPTGSRWLPRAAPPAGARLSSSTTC